MMASLDSSMVEAIAGDQGPGGGVYKTRGVY